MLILTTQRVIFSLLKTFAITWQHMEDTFLNTPLDPWRSQWSSGRRRTLTEEWVLLCFQSTVQLVQGACVLQHLWSLSAPRVKERNTSIMGITTFVHSSENIQFTSSNLKHILHQCLPGLLKHFQVIVLFTKDNKKGAKGEKRRQKKWLKRKSDEQIKLMTWGGKSKEEKRTKFEWRNNIFNEQIHSLYNSHWILIALYQDSLGQLSPTC